MERRVIDLEIAAELIGRSDSSLVQCRLCEEDFAQLHLQSCGDHAGLYVTGDWIECEGGLELLVDADRNIVGYDGWYGGCDKDGRWSD